MILFFHDGHEQSFCKGKSHFTNPLEFSDCFSEYNKQKTVSRSTSLTLKASFHKNIPTRTTLL